MRLLAPEERHLAHADAVGNALDLHLVGLRIRDLNLTDLGPARLDDEDSLSRPLSALHLSPACAIRVRNALQQQSRRLDAEIAGVSTCHRVAFDVLIP